MHERRPSLFNREEGKSRGENRCQGDHKGCYQFSSMIIVS